MADFKVIETQEDFDKAIQKRLEQKDREAAEKYKDYLSPEDVATLKGDHEKALQAALDQVKAEKEKSAGYDQTIEELTKKAASAERALLKSQIANETGVPLELADRLQGETAEEIKKDAEKVAGFLAPKNAPPLRTTEPANVLVHTGNPDIDSKNAAAAAMLSFLPQLTPGNN